MNLTKRKQHIFGTKDKQKTEYAFYDAMKEKCNLYKTWNCYNCNGKGWVDNKNDKRNKIRCGVCDASGREKLILKHTYRSDQGGCLGSSVLEIVRSNSGLDLEIHEQKNGEDVTCNAYISEEQLDTLKEYLLSERNNIVEGVITTHECVGCGIKMITDLCSSGKMKIYCMSCKTGEDAIDSRQLSQRHSLGED